MTATFEHGLAQITNGRTVHPAIHFINPIAGTGTLCQSTTDPNRLAPTTATEVTCGRCIAAADRISKFATARSTTK